MGRPTVLPGQPNTLTSVSTIPPEGLTAPLRDYGRARVLRTVSQLCNSDGIYAIITPNLPTGG